MKTLNNQAFDKKKLIQQAQQENLFPTSQKNPTIKIKNIKGWNVPLVQLDESAIIAKIQDKIMSTYGADYLNCMLEKETRQNYSNPMVKHQEGWEARALTVDLLMKLQNEFKQKSHTFNLAVLLFDNYLRLKENLSLEYLKMAAITCLFIASKLIEIRPINCEILIKSYLIQQETDSMLTEEVLENFELEVMKVLNYDLMVPTSSEFMYLYQCALDMPIYLQKLTRIIHTMCLLCVNFSSHKPSNLAAACICVGLNVIEKQDLIINTMYLIGKDWEAIQDLAQLVYKFCGNYNWKYLQFEVQYNCKVTNNNRLVLIKTLQGKEINQEKEIAKLIHMGSM